MRRTTSSSSRFTVVRGELSRGEARRGHRASPQHEGGLTATLRPTQLFRYGASGGPFPQTFEQLPAVALILTVKLVKWAKRWTD